MTINMNTTFTGILNQNYDISNVILQSVIILFQFLSGVAVILIKRALNKSQTEMKKDIEVINNKVDTISNHTTPRTIYNEPINAIDDKVLDDLKMFWRSKGFDLEYNLTPR